ncbi:MAG: hypothetical protein JSS62_04365 [Verrucomicrobia bacterium]|nr:hypothetical protein [Verrucomicrobiota bacterium]MBS0646279.1 hypothetical protein [Verrucomicrobiota bacterium]
MNPLLLTLTFLTLIGILTSSELLQHTQNKFCNDLLCQSMQQEKLCSAALQKALLEDLSEDLPQKIPSKTSKMIEKKSQSKTHARKSSKSLRYNTARPPNNSRLNFFFVVQEEDPFWLQAAANLMRHLYADHSFFLAIPNAEQEILKALIAHKHQAQNFEYPDDLASLDLENPVLQEIFYQMLKGNFAPSLLNFITYESPATPNQRKLNLLFAPSELLQVLFPDNFQQVEYLVAEVWQDILASEATQDPQQRLSRITIRQSLLKKIEDLCCTTHLALEEAKKHFDFTLGKSGTILFIEDPVTGELQRTKIPARQKN